MELIGAIGAFLLAICTLPLSYTALKSGKSEINSGFLYLWTFGEIFTLIYLISIGERVIIWNYVANLVLLIPVIVYKLKPRK